MTIERVHKRFGITRKVENIDKEIMEAQEELIPAAYLQGKPYIWTIAGYPRITRDITGHTKTCKDHQRRWGYENHNHYLDYSAMDLDRVTETHKVFYHGEGAKINLVSYRVLAGEEINKVRAGNNNVLFRWKPTTDTKAQDLVASR